MVYTVSILLLIFHTSFHSFPHASHHSLFPLHISPHVQHYITSFSIPPSYLTTCPTLYHIILHSPFISHHMSNIISHHSPFPLHISPHVQHYITSFSIPPSYLTTCPTLYHIILHSPFISHHMSNIISHHSPFPLHISPHVQHYITSFSIPPSYLTTCPTLYHIILHSPFISHHMSNIISHHSPFPLHISPHVQHYITSFSIPPSYLTTCPTLYHIILHSPFISHHMSNIISHHSPFPLHISPHVQHYITSFSIPPSYLTTCPTLYHIILHSPFISHHMSNIISHHSPFPLHISPHVQHYITSFSIPPSYLTTCPTLYHIILHSPFISHHMSNIISHHSPFPLHISPHVQHYITSFSIPPSYLTTCPTLYHIILHSPFISHHMSNIISHHSPFPLHISPHVQHYITSFSIPPSYLTTCPTLYHIILHSPFISHHMSNIISHHSPFPLHISPHVQHLYHSTDCVPLIVVSILV